MSSHIRPVFFNLRFTHTHTSVSEPGGHTPKRKQVGRFNHAPFALSQRTGEAALGHAEDVRAEALQRHLVALAVDVLHLHVQHMCQRPMESAKARGVGVTEASVRSSFTGKRKNPGPSSASPLPVVVVAVVVVLLLLHFEWAKKRCSEWRSEDSDGSAKLSSGCLLNTNTAAPSPPPETSGDCEHHRERGE